MGLLQPSIHAAYGQVTRRHLRRVMLDSQCRRYLTSAGLLRIFIDRQAPEATARAQSQCTIGTVRKLWIPPRVNRLIK